MALVDENGPTTYEVLHRRTNQLARHLRARGVAPGVFVGVALQRSAALVETLLAVVKSGAAYVPVDPDYPSLRISSMLEQVKPRVVVTLRDLIPRLPSLEDTTLLAIDELDLSGENEEDLPASAAPEDPLYVIFTSGSTGAPKGAVVHRRGFANLIEWFGREFSFGPGDKTLLLSSPSFDLTQKNFFTPFQTGGALVCYPSGPFDLVRLADMIEHHGITAMNCTPSTFYPLVDNDHALQKLRSLRLAVLGGEPIAIARVRPWLESNPAAEIANTYGPTECTDICGYYRLNRANLENFPFVPLGHTIPNVQLSVVDEELRPVPPGESGELIIGGAGVGLGYLGDPARNSEKFLPNSLSGQLEGAKVYRTGDRVRLLPEGELEFLGRMDHQIKLRGFRIELADIEVALSAHPSIREAVVILEQAAGDPTLCAFYTLKNNATSTEDLRTFLAARLPEYMMPVMYTALENFPLTPNGKVNRLQLASSSAAPSTPTPSVFPQGNSLESAIQKLWSASLGHDAFDLDANFFDLGGNSIQLATVHARLIDIVGRPIPITDLFAHATIRSLASHLSGTNLALKDNAIQQRALKQRQALASRRPIRS